MFWKIRGQNLACNKTLLMGIVNVTPDSFSDGGNFLDPEKAVRQCLKLIEDGADILDLGAESTRPGAEAVSADEELNRLLPVLEKILNKSAVPISIDTTKAEVARACLERGANIINDVSAMQISGPAMAAAVRDFGAGLILMHRRGNPKTMQGEAIYHDVVEEVWGELESSVDKALASGICRDQLAIDPGLGFAKTAEQSLEIMSHLERFQEMRLPVMLGPSRKSFIRKITPDREAGTLAVCKEAVFQKVQILRVHDVASVRKAIGEEHVWT